MAKSFFTIDEISQIVNGKGASLLPKKEVKEKEPLTDRDELLKMVFGGSILPSQTLQDSALQLDQALASNKALNGLRTATAVASLVGDAAVEAVGIAEESYNNIHGENALAKKISEKPLKRLKGAFGSEGKKRILAALGIDEEDTREVEVEGGEIIENEDGTTQKVEGPRHEQGGVDAMIDDDATVYSDRLQSLIGASKVEKTAKSIAEEKEKRDAKALSLQKKLEKNPNDRLLANTLALTLQQNMIADQMDLMWQQVARTGLEEQAGGKEQLMNAMFNKQESKESEEGQQTDEKIEQQQEEEQEQEEEVNQEKLAMGVESSLIMPADQEAPTDEQKKKEEEEKIKRIQAIAGGVGDILGNQLYSTGAIISGLGGLNTTLQQRSEDILHENKYKGLARGVDKLYEQSISNISNVTNKRLQEMLNESQTTKQSIGNNFQSISNMAAYNAMLDDAVNKELAKIRGEELGAITGVQDARAKTLSANMQKEMEGQGIAEALNDADRDAFYNALHLDYANIGQQMQAVASNMNKKYEDKTDLTKLLDAIENIGKDNKPQGGGQNTETEQNPNNNNPESETEQVPTPSATTSTSSTQPEAPTVATNTKEVTPPQQPTQQPEASTVNANTGTRTPPLPSTVTEEVQSNDEDGLAGILKDIGIAQYLKQNQPEDANTGARTTSPLLAKPVLSDGRILEELSEPELLYLYEHTNDLDGNDMYLVTKEVIRRSAAETENQTNQSAQTTAANAGTGTTSPLSTIIEKTKSNDEDPIKKNGLYGILEYLNSVQYLKQNQPEATNAEEVTPSPQSPETEDDKAGAKTAPPQPAQPDDVPSDEELKNLTYKEVSKLFEYAVLNNLSDEAKLRLAQEMEKKEKEEKTQQKTNNKEDNSDIVAQQETQEHNPEVEPITEAPIQQEKKNEQNKKDAKKPVDVTKNDIEEFTKDIKMIKTGKYRKSFITDRLDMYKIYINSKINYPEGDISEEKKRQFEATLSEARELMDEYEININSYIPIKKEKGEKYTDILLFNSSGDAKSTLEGAIDEKQSKEITQDELLTLIRNINTEDDYFSESYVAPSFANVDIYDKERYPLSTLKEYRESPDFSNSEKEFLDKLIERREFVDDAIKNGKIPVTEHALFKLDLARDEDMYWLNENPSLQINVNSMSYPISLSKDFLTEYEENKDNLVFFNNKIKTYFNYAIDQIKDLYGSNDTKLKEFEEQMKKRNENIKIAEEQGKIIYEKNYPFYIYMDKIDQHPIYLNTRGNLIRLKETITGIIDDYEKNKDKFYYPDDLGNNSTDGKESHSKEIMYLKNKMNQIEEKLKGFEQKEQTE